MLKVSTEFRCPDISADDMERLNSMLVLNSVELSNKLEVDNTNSYQGSVEYIKVSPFPKHTWRPVKGIEEQEKYFQENFYHLLDPQQTSKKSVNELSPPSREGSSPSLYIEKTDHDNNNSVRAPLRAASVSDSIYGNIRIFAPASKNHQSQLVKKSSVDGAGAEVDHQTIIGTKP